MTAGDIVQSKGGNSGGGKIATGFVTLPAAPTAGNIVLVAFSADSAPTTIPAGFTATASPDGNFLYQSTTATGTSWSFGFGASVAFAWFAAEFAGTATFANGASGSSSSPSTTSAGPSIASTAGDVLLDYCYIGVQGAPGAVTAVTNGYTIVGNSGPTTVSGGFNFQVGMATKKSTGAASATTATLSASSYWTHFQIAATFGTSAPDTPPTTPTGTVFRLDAGATLTPVSLSPLA